MSLSIPTKTGTLQFEGPYTNTNDINNTSGAYVITTLTNSGTHAIIDTGMSAHLKARLDDHDRKDCWKRHEQNGIYASVIYCNESDRINIENNVRKSYNPPCGER